VVDDESLLVAVAEAVANEHDDDVESLDELDEFETEYLIEEAVEDEELVSMPLSQDSNEDCCVMGKFVSLFIFINCFAFFEKRMKNLCSRCLKMVKSRQVFKLLVKFRHQLLQKCKIDVIFISKDY
jgi:hypothetical protein